MNPEQSFVLEEVFRAEEVMGEFVGKIMILGASYSQIPLIRAAKRLGYEALAVSIPGNYAGFAEADRIIYADISDPEAVLRAAEEERIDGITTCCMDVGIRAQGYVCEKLGLPGPGIFGTEASCDKSVEKAAYVRCGVNTAAYALVSDENELKEALKRLHFPVILKAVDLMGSRGIFRADSEEEACICLRRSLDASRKTFCIVEEFLEGQMFGVEAMISRGKPAFCLPLGNVMRKGNPTFPIGHYVPWERADELSDAVEEQVMGVAKALGFDNCGMDLDCMYLDGKIYVIEATARAGATCITDTVSIRYGIDYYEALIRAAVGEDTCAMFRKTAESSETELPVGISSAMLPRRASITRLLSAEREGIVTGIHIPDSLPEEVYGLSFNVKPGDQVRPMANGADRAGQLIVCSDSLARCGEVMDRVLSGIRIETEDSGGL
jgi:biotin carboxylase